MPDLLERGDMILGSAPTARGDEIAVEIRDGSIYLLLPCDSHNPKPVELGDPGARTLASLLTIARRFD